MVKKSKKTEFSWQVLEEKKKRNKELVEEPDEEPDEELAEELQQ